MQIGFIFLPLKSHKTFIIHNDTVSSGCLLLSQGGGGQLSRLIQGGETFSLASFPLAASVCVCARTSMHNCSCCRIMCLKTSGQHYRIYCGSSLVCVCVCVWPIAGYEIWMLVRRKHASGNVCDDYSLSTNTDTHANHEPPALNAHAPCRRKHAPCALAPTLYLNR